MGLSATALLTVAELKDYVSPGATGAANDTRLELVINRASALLDRALERELVTRGNITEYHTVRPGECSLRLSQWPTIAVTSVYEDSSRAFAAASLLTVTTDYIVSAPEGRLIRVLSAQPTSWRTGWRVIKVVHSAGYLKTDATPVGALAVPDDLKDAALKLAAKLWMESTRQQWGVSGMSDNAGNWTRLEATALSKDILAQIAPFNRYGFGDHTWERDA
jgi:hypothetical protein